MAERPIADFDAYRQQLSDFVFKTGPAMKTVFERARRAPTRIAYADGESERVLRAVQGVLDEGIARPILIGRPDVVDMRIDRLGLRMRAGVDFELVNPHHDSRYREYWTEYQSLMERQGGSPAEARNLLLTNNTVISSVMLRRGEVDGMICGIAGRFTEHLTHVQNILGLREGIKNLYAMTALITQKGTLFICDTHAIAEPTAEQTVEMTVLAAEVVMRFGMGPKIALLSHSNFGDRDSGSSRKMRRAYELLKENHPDLDVEGEMHADAAFSDAIRQRVLPNSQFKGEANLLIMPTLDAANISYNLLKSVTDSVAIGPILLGTARTAHIVTPSASVRRIMNMTAISVVEAQAKGVTEQQELAL